MTNKVKPIKSVGLLLDVEGLEMRDKFLDFVRELGVKDLHVEVLACLPKKHQVVDFKGAIFTPAGVNWFGRVKVKEVREFIVRPFDMLLVYHREETKTLTRVKEASKAQLKVGRQQEGSLEFDLGIITAFEEVDVFLEEVKKYLKILNKIN